jgi:hypothetical protein
MRIALLVCVVACLGVRGSSVSPSGASGSAAINIAGMERHGRLVQQR